MDNGREEEPLFTGLESPAIAQNEPVASARFVTADVPREISQGIAGWRVGNFCIDQKEKSARPAKWRVSGDDHAAHRFHPKQQRPS
jgi:hypothetical protein